MTTLETHTSPLGVRVDIWAASALTGLVQPLAVFAAGSLLLPWMVAPALMGPINYVRLAAAILTPALLIVPLGLCCGAAVGGAIRPATKAGALAAAGAITAFVSTVLLVPPAVVLFAFMFF